MALKIRNYRQADTYNGMTNS